MAVEVIVMTLAPSTMEVQAYYGPVRGMIANYSCDDGSTGSSKATDDDGMAVLLVHLSLPT